MESCQVALTLRKGGYGALGPVEKFGKLLRDYELVHWELLESIHSFSKWFLNTYHVKVLYCEFVCRVCYCYCDVLKFILKNYPFQIIISLQFTKRMGEDWLNPVFS